MKIKISDQLKNIKGESLNGSSIDVENFVKSLPVDLQKGIIPFFNAQKGEPTTLKNVCINAILSPIQDEHQEAKFKKWEIYKKFRDAKDEIVLTVEEIKIVKDAIGKFFPPLIMGQCFELLEK